VHAKYIRTAAFAGFLQLHRLSLLVELLQEAGQARIGSQLEVILMTKVQGISPPFQVIPVLSRGNTLLIDIGLELVGELSRDLSHEYYPVSMISSKTIII
jgi:hypothetical protein